MSGVCVRPHARESLSSSCLSTGAGSKTTCVQPIEHVGVWAAGPPALLPARSPSTVLPRTLPGRSSVTHTLPPDVHIGGRLSKGLLRDQQHARSYSCSSTLGVSNASVQKGDGSESPRDGTGQPPEEDRRAEQASHTTGKQRLFAVFSRFL